MEIWKPVLGYEGLYEISNLGRVKTGYYKKEKILKLWKKNCGHSIIGLCNDGARNEYLTILIMKNSFDKSVFFGIIFCFILSFYLAGYFFNITLLKDYAKITLEYEQCRKEINLLIK